MIIPDSKGVSEAVFRTFSETESMEYERLDTARTLLILLGPWEEPLFAVFGVGIPALIWNLAVGKEACVDITPALLHRLHDKDVGMWRQAVLGNIQGTVAAELVVNVEPPLSEYRDFVLGLMRFSENDLALAFRIDLRISDIEGDLMTILDQTRDELAEELGEALAKGEKAYCALKPFAN